MKPLVSIAFMLKYWGPTLDEFFKRLKSQKIDYPFEIVVAYYGKDDELYKKLLTLATKVTRIKPEEYNCGSTRDLACRESSGKYIVTLSVDSLPLNDSWLKNMVEPLINNEADVVQGKVQCPEKGDPNYRDFFYWERDFGFYFTSEGEKFYKKHGDFGTYGYFGLAAPNLSFKKSVWEKTGFSGVRYNGDTVFQKRISENHFKAIYKEDAVVLHAHSYKTIKSLFNRCSNEGIGWKDINETYGFLTMLKDICRVDMHIKAFRAFINKDMKFKSEFFFIFIRPIALYWGNHYAKSLYNDSRK